jgi:hypothetical protein
MKKKYFIIMKQKPISFKLCKVFYCSPKIKLELISVSFFLYLLFFNVNVGIDYHLLFNIIQSHFFDSHAEWTTMFF